MSGSAEGEEAGARTEAVGKRDRRRGRNEAQKAQNSEAKNGLKRHRRRKTSLWGVVAGPK